MARYKKVFLAERPMKQTKRRSTLAISFHDEECEGVLYSHDDALVVIFLVANYTTRRILINNGSTIDVLFWDAIKKMGIDPNKLSLSPTSLKCFLREVVQPLGAITLPVSSRKGTLILHCNPRVPNSEQIESHHLHLSLNDKVPYEDRSRGSQRRASVGERVNRGRDV